MRNPHSCRSLRRLYNQVSMVWFLCGPWGFENLCSSVFMWCSFEFMRPMRLCDFENLRPLGCGFGIVGTHAVNEIIRPMQSYICKNCMIYAVFAVYVHIPKKQFMQFLRSMSTFLRNSKYCILQCRSFMLVNLKDYAARAVYVAAVLRHSLKPKPHKNCSAILYGPCGLRIF